MAHVFVDIADKTMCSRCGSEVKRVDEVCPAVSDGAIYAAASYGEIVLGAARVAEWPQWKRDQMEAVSKREPD